MKFSSGIDQMQREVSFLKLLTKSMLCLNIALIVIVWNLYDKAPLLVERSTHGLEMLIPTDLLRSEADIRRAVYLMMKARFETDAVSPELFLNAKQLVLRDNEQKEMKSRGMYQAVIIRSIAFKKDEAAVELDRVISIADIRSALRTKIKITFEEQTPNEMNPYGLLLSLADPIEIKQEK
jgi:hypothetical protein